MPAAWDEFTVSELAAVLGESRGAADDLLGLAHDLEVKLPGTKAAFRDGILSAPGPGSSPGPPRSLTRPRLAGPRRWCSTGRAG